MDEGSQNVHWDLHRNHLQSMFANQLDQGRFCDVELACEGGRTIKAHRSVLCACSSYFDSILTNSTINKETFVIIKDCKIEDLKLIIDFMYIGEISVDRVHLPKLQKIAQDLQVTGLVEAFNSFSKTKNSKASDTLTPQNEPSAASSSKKRQRTYSRGASESRPKITHIESISNSTITEALGHAPQLANPNANLYDQQSNENENYCYRIIPKTENMDEYPTDEEEYYGDYEENNSSYMENQTNLRDKHTISGNINEIILQEIKDMRAEMPTHNKKRFLNIQKSLNDLTIEVISIKQALKNVCESSNTDGQSFSIPYPAINRKISSIRKEDFDSLNDEKNEDILREYCQIVYNDHRFEIKGDLVKYFQKVLKTLFAKDFVRDMSWNKFENKISVGKSIIFNIIQESGIQVDPISNVETRLRALKQALVKAKDSMRKKMNRTAPLDAASTIRVDDGSTYVNIASPQDQIQFKSESSPTTSDAPN